MADVFVSYSSNDREVAARIVRLLESRGWRVSNRRKRIRRCVVSVSGMVVLISAFYVAATLHNELTTWQAGIRYIERGAYSKPENERLKTAIRRATQIDMLVPNAASVTSFARADFPVFFKNPGSAMRVLFANPDSVFYDQMMMMTTNGIERDNKAHESDEQMPRRSRRQLLSFAGENASKIQIRMFDTEFRNPIILIDRRYCFLTVRLTPDQAEQSLRIELVASSAGNQIEQSMYRALREIAFLLSPSTDRDDNVESCVRHFDAIWSRSKELP